MPGARERDRLRLSVAVAAVMFYAATWPLPPGLQAASAAFAVTLASGTFGRLGGGVAAAAAVAITPLPLPVRLALVVVALVGGELRHRALQAGRAMAARSFTDRLTGLRNYDYFCEALTAELARVRRYGGCTTLVLLDLDRFKAFNDRHGHAAGNRALSAVGPPDRPSEARRRCGRPLRRRGVRDPGLGTHQRRRCRGRPGAGGDPGSLHHQPTPAHERRRDHRQRRHRHVPGRRPRCR